MRRSSWNYYGIKLIYQAVITGPPIPERIDENFSDGHTIFEESVMLIRAQSFDHAYAVAERKARENEATYKNPYGQTVEWKLIDAIDCFLIGDEISSGTELYSSMSSEKKEVTPSGYLMQKYQYNLDDYEWNHKQREKDRKIQYIIRHE